MMRQRTCVWSLKGPRWRSVACQDQYLVLEELKESKNLILTVLPGFSGWECLEEEKKVGLMEERQTCTGYGLWEATSWQWETSRKSSTDMEPTPAPASGLRYSLHSQSAGPSRSWGSRKWSHLVPQPPWPWSLDLSPYPVVLMDQSTHSNIVPGGLSGGGLWCVEAVGMEEWSKMNYLLFTEVQRNIKDRPCFLFLKPQYVVSSRWMDFKLIEFIDQQDRIIYLVGPF